MGENVWVILLLGIVTGWLASGCQSTSDAVRMADTVTEAVQKVTEGDKIEQLFEHDKRFEAQSKRYQQNGIPRSAAVTTAVDSMMSLDLGSYPREVRGAYSDHRDAWRAYQRVLTDKSSQDKDRAIEQIERTWERMQQLAREYGATTSVDPYVYPGEETRTIVAVEVAEEVGDYFSGPDINVKVYKDNRLVCDRSGVDARMIQPNCTLQVGPPSRVLIDVVEEDVQNDDPVASWEMTGAELLRQSTFSFGNVTSMRVK